MQAAGSCDIRFVSRSVGQCRAIALAMNEGVLSLLSATMTVGPLWMLCVQSGCWHIPASQCRFCSDPVEPGHASGADCLT